MFGNKKNKLEEQIKGVFSRISEERQSLEEELTKYEDREKQIYADVCQVMDNSHEVVNHAMINIEEEAGLIHTLDDFSRELQEAVEEYGLLTENAEKQYEAIMALVEENKHYTTPARALTEAPGALKQSCQSYERKLDDLAEKGRKMGVMALNAAIEAGRMGDSAKQFVTVAEEIRQTALSYEKEALALQEEVAGQREKIEELEDIIHRFVGLIKESNMGTARLLKKGQEIHQLTEKSSMRDFSDDMIAIRDKVVGLRNLDEEVAKCGERNKLQLSSIQEEVQTQKQVMAELESDMFQLLDTAEEQLSGLR